MKCLKIKVYKYKWATNMPQAEQYMDEEEKNAYLDKRLQEEIEDMDAFSDFLADEYCSYVDVFNLTESEKNKVKAKWAENCREYVEDLFEDDWEEIEITVKVPYKALVNSAIVLIDKSE